MTDRRFGEIVGNVQHIADGRGYGAKALCSTCGEYEFVWQEEFENDSLSQLVRTEDGLDFEPYVPRGAGDAEVLKYVAKMRAWNCCHYGEEPIDGFPEEVEPPSTIEWDEP